MSDRPTLYRWCDDGSGEPASRADLLAALGAEWKCFEKWDTDDYPCPPDSTLHYGLCSWRVSPVEPVDE